MVFRKGAPNPGRKFQKGVSGNPGGRPRKTDYQARMEELIREEVGEDDWRAVVAAALADAKAGKPEARQWLTVHVVGKEPDRLEVDATTDNTHRIEVVEVVAEPRRGAEAARRPAADPGRG